MTTTRTNAILVLLCIGAAWIAYLRLPDLLSEFTHGYEEWEISMFLTSGALCVGAVSTLAILVTMALYGRPR